MCSERSGSNFITKVMNGHEDICGPSTKHIINPVARNFYRYGNLMDENAWNELISDIERLLSLRFSFWKKKMTKEYLDKLAPKGDLISLLKNIFIEEAKANNKVHIFVKENQLYEFMTFLIMYFPEAKYIYQVRDPRDMALSWKKNDDHKGGVTHAAKQWKKDQMQFLKNHEVLKKQCKSYMIHYEELISDFDNKINELCDFIGVPHSESMKEFYKDELTIKNSLSNPAWENLSKRVISNNMSKFENELSDDEISIIEHICYPEMVYLGYQPKFGVNVKDKYSNEDLERMINWESQNIPWKPQNGVLKNMDAKKVFYQKVL
jgi:hypothetical protein